MQSLCGLPPCYRGDDGGLFTHLHTVNVDPVAWPADVSQLLDSHPTTHTVLEAIQGRVFISRLFTFYLPFLLFSFRFDFTLKFSFHNAEQSSF